MNFALVSAELDKKVKQRQQVQKMTKLSESKLRIAQVLPRLIFRRRLRAFRLFKERLLGDQSRSSSSMAQSDS